jgi:hypothetical protein
LKRDDRRQGVVRVGFHANRYNFWRAAYRRHVAVAGATSGNAQPRENEYMLHEYFAHNCFTSTSIASVLARRLAAVVTMAAQFVVFVVSLTGTNTSS